MHVQTHSCTHTHSRRHMHTHRHHTYMQTRHTHTNTHRHRHTNTHSYADTQAHKHKNICTRVRICVCVCEYSATHPFSPHSIYPVAVMKSVFGTRDYGYLVPETSDPSSRLKKTCRFANAANAATLTFRVVLSVAHLHFICPPWDSEKRCLDCFVRLHVK